MIKVLNNPNVQSNFELEEFVCKCGCEQTKYDYEGILLLQVLREHFENIVTIVSPYRCKKHNDAVGGAPESKHMDGIAWDIKVKNVDPVKVAQFALKIGFTGIGVYTNNGNYFVHVDIRNVVTPVLWRDQAGTKELVKVTNTILWR